MDKEHKKSGFRNQFIAGFVGGGSSVLLLHPLDLLKTRFQAQSSSKYAPLLSFAKELGSIYSGKGIKGLYRGFSANFTGSTTSWASYFFLYEIAKGNFKTSKETNELLWWQYLSSSTMAGMITVAIANPIWLAKTRMCQDGSSGDGLIKTLREVWLKEAGIRGLYRGFGAGLLGTSHGAVQFLFYEKMKNTFKDDRSAFTYLGMSSSSKILASLITYPYQVVRSRVQLAPIGISSSSLAPSSSTYKYSNITDVLVKTWRAEGLLGFYKGMIPNILRVLPGTCVTFLVYEKVLIFLSK